MSVNLYDKALLEKLNNWTKNTEMTVVGPDESRRIFEVVADNNNDKPIRLPMLVLTRPGGYSVNDQGLAKRPLSYNGAKLRADVETSVLLNAIPITIPYQLDVYCRYFEQADEYSRNLVFNIINFPKLTITIPYNGENYRHDSNIRMDGGIEDNSGIPERLVAGQFTRLTIALDIDDAYLWDVRKAGNWTICDNFQVIAKDG